MRSMLLGAGNIATCRCWLGRSPRRLAFDHWEQGERRRATGAYHILAEYKR